jgi:hypothetical protein
MVESIKTRLIDAVRTMARWPVIGRFIRVGVAIIRLPEFKVACCDFIQRQHSLEAEKLPVLRETLAALNERQLLVMERFTLMEQHIDQLDSLIKKLSEDQLVFDERQVVFDQRQDALVHSVSDLDLQLANANLQNLVQSLPVTLRKIRRDIVEIQRLERGAVASSDATAHGATKSNRLTDAMGKRIEGSAV